MTFSINVVILELYKSSELPTARGDTVILGVSQAVL